MFDQEIAENIQRREALQIMPIVSAEDFEFECYQAKLAAQMYRAFGFSDLCLNLSRSNNRAAEKS